MSKDKKKKHKGDQPAEPLSKKQRKELERREAEIAAELAEREAEAAASKKKGKKAKKPDVGEVIKKKKAERQAAAVEVDDTVFVDADGAEPVDEAHVTEVALDVLNDPRSSPGAKSAAQAKLDSFEKPVEPTAEETDAEIKKRLADKKVLRANYDEARAALDTSDEPSVVLFNDTYGRATGKYATGDAEVAKAAASIAEPSQVAEEVATEQGRVFEVGESAATPHESDRGFALPSDSKPEIEVGRNGYKITTPDGKKQLQYTRITTFIKLIEDKTNLEAWTKRKLMQGIILDQTPGEDGSVSDRLGVVRDLVHNRDVAIAKARKADRKGKLGVGELATLIDDAEKALKAGLDPIVTELEELGGSKVAAAKGTDIHALTELYDAEGLSAIDALLAEEKISPADFADLEAYGAAMGKAQVKVLETEVMVVNDDKRRAGRLDKVVMVRLPGAQRATKMVADVKTGSVDYGISIPMQLENYAQMLAYDPENPTERRKLGLSATKGLLIHLPQGKAECHIYVVDLATGRLGNRITQEAREYRNTAKKGIDFSVDLGTGIAFAEAS